MKKCPGQDLSLKRLEDAVSVLKCPRCGYGVEFFFDDGSRRCPGCGLKVKKSGQKLLEDFGCAGWCTSAEDCLGSETYERLNSARSASKAAKKTKA